MMQSNVKIAITGGIGSGKSEVCKIISTQNIPVFSCDEIYKRLCGEREFINKLQSEFDGIIAPDGSIDRTALSKIVFNDKNALNKLNGITHPQIFSRALEEMSKYDLSFLEVPLLFEGGYEELFDGVLVILRDKGQRLESVVNRSKISPQEALLRINSQIDYDNTSFAKYYVIHNDGNLSNLEQKTREFLKDIKKHYKNF